jgi:hypothetical protein
VGGLILERFFTKINKLFLDLFLKIKFKKKAIDSELEMTSMKQEPKILSLMAKQETMLNKKRKRIESNNQNKQRINLINTKPHVLYRNGSKLIKCCGKFHLKRNFRRHLDYCSCPLIRSIQVQCDKCHRRCAPEMDTVIHGINFYVSPHKCHKTPKRNLSQKPESVRKRKYRWKNYHKYIKAYQKSIEPRILFTHMQMLCFKQTLEYYIYRFVNARSEYIWASIDHYGKYPKYFHFEDGAEHFEALMDMIGVNREITNEYGFYIGKYYNHKITARNRNNICPIPLKIKVFPNEPTLTYLNACKQRRELDYLFGFVYPERFNNEKDSVLNKLKTNEFVVLNEECQKKERPLMKECSTPFYPPRIQIASNKMINNMYRYFK